ncbi:DedA family protein [Chloroflexota bacterium]
MTKTDKETQMKRGHRKWEYYIGILGVVLTIAMAVSVVYFWDFVQALEGYGYAGAFFVSILGGATIIIPVPMLAVVFALGGVLTPYWVGVAAGLGETIGALTIYMTGYGGGTAILNSNHGKLQSAYIRLMGLMERRGSWTLFFLSAMLNPFFYPAALTAGALRFGVRRYFLLCWGGKTIKGLTVAYAGYYGLRGLLRMLGMPI